MKVLIVYHSVYGHILTMAGAVEEGINSVNGAEAVMRRAPEFEDHPQFIESQRYAKEVWQQQKDIPVCTLDDLREAQGLALGTPTRYGNMSAQMKRLIDSTGPLWLKGEMEGKPAGIFTSTATTHGGQGTTIITSMIPLMHMGMLIVGVPYSTPGMLHTEGRGGTPYGPTTVAGGSNELKPATEDLDLARFLGKRLAEITIKLRA